MRVLPVLLAGVFAAPGAAAEETLSGERLIAAYSGKTHISYYRHPVEEYGGIYFEETYHPDGTLDYRAGDVALAGLWRVDGDKICFDYPETPLNSGCFNVVADQGCYYSYQLGDDDAPLAEADGQWWIRAHIRGATPDCAAGDLVS